MPAPAAAGISDRGRAGAGLAGHDSRGPVSILPREQPQSRPLVVLIPLGRVAGIVAFRSCTVRFCRVVLRGLAEQPLPDVFSDGLEPAVVDPLAVVPAHRAVAVPHDGVAGYRVTTGISDRPEYVAEGIEGDAVAAQVQLLQQFRKLD